MIMRDLRRCKCVCGTALTRVSRWCPQRLPHPEFEWALYDIGGVIGFAAYMSIAWHMMHVRKWTLARREARRKRRERRAARRRLGASASSTTLDTVPGAGPEADQTYYGVLSSGALEALENRAPMLRNQLCKCNTVVFTSGSAVTFTAAVFVVSYLSMCVASCGTGRPWVRRHAVGAWVTPQLTRRPPPAHVRRYAIVFLSSEDTKEALYNLHMTLIPTYFIVGGSLVAVVNAVAAIMFMYVAIAPEPAPSAAVPCGWVLTLSRPVSQHGSAQRPSAVSVVLGVL